MNWPTYPGFKLPPCLPCCDQPAPPTDCHCALRLPFDNSEWPGGGKFADYEAAKTFLETYTRCYVYGRYGSPFYHPTGVLTEFSANWNAAGDRLTLYSLPYGTLSCSVSVKAGGVTLGWDMHGPGNWSIQISVYKCGAQDFEPEDMLVFSHYEDYEAGSSPGSTVWTADEDGEYMVVFMLGELDEPETIECYVEAPGMTANPIEAAYADGAETRIMEACPRLLLPLLTEATGDWYEDLAAAQAVMADHVFDCLAYRPNLDILSSLSVAVGTNSVTLTIDLTVAENSAGEVWLSINLTQGDIISLSGTGANKWFTLYDSEGTELEYVLDDSSSPAPYTGRYIVALDASLGRDTYGANWELTLSGGDLTVNRVQALYDSGLECPGRLDCPEEEES